MKLTGKEKGCLIGIATGVVYGIFIRYLGMPQHKKELEQIAVMSLGFMAVTPFIIGWLSVRWIEVRELSKKEAFFWPFVPVLLGCFATFLFRWEGIICILMLLPLALPMAGLGGLFARSQRNKTNASFALLLLPFAVQWGENQVDFKTRFQTVQNSVVIQAPASRVWDEIKSVRTINRSELSDSWVHRMGFPRPLDAEISFEGVGGVRTARFERGLVFTETVDVWTPNQVLSFEIKADPSAIPPEALDQHVTIGGPYFDVLRGTYRIEDRGDGTVILHLESQFRISTHFNVYAGVWTEMVMQRIQTDILSVIAKRAARSSVAAR